MNLFFYSHYILSVLLWAVILGFLQQDAPFPGNITQFLLISLLLLMIIAFHSPDQSFCQFTSTLIILILLLFKEQWLWSYLLITFTGCCHGNQSFCLCWRCGRSAQYLRFVSAKLVMVFPLSSVCWVVRHWHSCALASVFGCSISTFCPQTAPQLQSIRFRHFRH